MYSNQKEVYNDVGGVSGGGGGRQNLQELDTLLDDLNRSRFAGNGTMAPSGGGSTNYADSGRRPSVDALLNELSNAVVSKSVRIFFYPFFFIFLINWWPSVACYCAVAPSSGSLCK